MRDQRSEGASGLLGAMTGGDEERGTRNEEPVLGEDRSPRTLPSALLHDHRDQQRGHLVEHLSPNTQRGATEHREADFIPVQ